MRQSPALVASICICSAARSPSEYPDGKGEWSIVETHTSVIDSGPVGPANISNAFIAEFRNLLPIYRPATRQRLISCSGK